jgi:hypothetical protein
VCPVQLLLLMWCHTGEYSPPHLVGDIPTCVWDKLWLDNCNAKSVCRHLLKKGELTRLGMALMVIDSDIFSRHLHGSAPTSFERQFRSMRPLLYNRLQAALPAEVRTFSAIDSVYRVGVPDECY